MRCFGYVIRVSGHLTMSGHGIKLFKRKIGMINALL